MENSNQNSQIFSAYSRGQSLMEGKQFVKILKDNGLLDKHLTVNEADIIFAKVKAKTERKITEREMFEGLKLCAQIKKISLEELIAQVNISGPQFKGTKTEKVPLHDDKTKYTGVYSRGGPTNIDVKIGVVSDLSQLTNRKEANVRGVNKDMLVIQN